MSECRLKLTCTYALQVGFCFKTLIVGADGIAQTYSTAKNTVSPQLRDAQPFLA